MHFMGNSHLSLAAPAPSPCPQLLSAIIILSPACRFKAKREEPSRLGQLDASSPRECPSPSCSRVRGAQLVREAWQRGVLAFLFPNTLTFLCLQEAFACVAILGNERSFVRGRRAQ